MLFQASAHRYLNLSRHHYPHQRPPAITEDIPRTQSPNKLTPIQPYTGTMAETAEPTPTCTNLTDPGLLEKFDKLFACNVGEYVTLPQLIAVGDQSSGKSSVLEGLTGLSFPRDSTLCTRFATQIIFRRATGQPSRRIRASIKPAPQSHPESIARLQAWSWTESASLGPEEFSHMIQEVGQSLCRSS